MYNESNNYCEVLIDREPDRKVQTTAKIYVVLAIVTALLAFFVNLFYLALTAVCLGLRYVLLSRAAVEYEYQFWGRQLDVDIIRNGDKRSKLVTYQLDEAEILARENDPVLEDYRALVGGEGKIRTRDLTDGDPQGRPVYLFYARENLEPVCVRLQPSHEMLRQMWRVAPGLVHIPAELRKEPELPEDEEE